MPNCRKNLRSSPAIDEQVSLVNKNTRYTVAVALIVSLGGFIACADRNMESQSSSAVKVEIVASDSGYQLLRGGEPYHIKGAGLEYGDIDLFAAHGGNSIRTWSTREGDHTAQEVLDNALKNGVTVALCLKVGVEHSGFNYDDPDAVATQLEDLREEVLKYRDHPALLVWIIGNELNYDYTNAKVYDAVNDVSRMIHELDPNHPTTTTIAGFNPDTVADISNRAPDLDFVSFQVYGQLKSLPDLAKQPGNEKPFFVTEWGAIGHWEVDKTNWGAPIEATSSEKADTYLNGYRDKLAPLEGHLIGSYVFLWGQKQERTPTWYGMFTESGEETETIDVMHYIWNGTWPDNRSPRLESMSLDGEFAEQNVELIAGQSYDATVKVSDPDNDALRYHWEVKPESDATQVGGDFEESIESLDRLISDDSAPAIQLIAPQEPGAYRLFVYIYDGQNHAAHANIPFLTSDDGGK